MLLAWGESRGIMALLRILLAPQQGQAPRRLALPGVRSICRLRQTWRQTPKSPIPISLDSRFGREMGRKTPFPDSARSGNGGRTGNLRFPIRPRTESGSPAGGGGPGDFGLWFASFLPPLSPEIRQSSKFVTLQGHRRRRRPLPILKLARSLRALPGALLN
jgi:hypothetical protein